MKRILMSGLVYLGIITISSLALIFGMVIWIILMPIKLLERIGKCL